MTSITYVPMLLYPLNASSDSISPEGGGGLPSIDLRGFAAGKNEVQTRSGRSKLENALGRGIVKRRNLFPHIILLLVSCL